MVRGRRSLPHQAGAPRALWAEAITFISEVRNRKKRKIDDSMVELWLLELRGNDETVQILPEQDCVEVWPIWGCQVIALLPLPARDDKLSSVAIMDDRTIVN